MGGLFEKIVGREYEETGKILQVDQYVLRTEYLHCSPSHAEAPTSKVMAFEGRAFRGN